jgi:hypothetical protein
VREFHPPPFRRALTSIRRRALTSILRRTRAAAESEGKEEGARRTEAKSPEEAPLAAGGGNEEVLARVSEAAAEEGEAYIECFVSVVQRLGREGTARLLRAKLTQRGFVARLAGMLSRTLPSPEVDKDSGAWGAALAAPGLPRVLQLLTGIAAGHAPAQAQVAARRYAKRALYTQRSVYTL